MSSGKCRLSILVLVRCREISPAILSDSNNDNAASLLSDPQKDHWVVDCNTNFEENMANFQVIAVPADGLALIESRKSTDPLMTTFDSLVNTLPVYKGFVS